MLIDSRREPDLKSRHSINPSADRRAEEGVQNSVRRIIDAARAEFGAKGFDGTRLEAVAERAGVTKQLIYHYFRGKADLYSEVLAEIEQLNINRLLRIDYDGLPPEEALKTFLIVLLDQCRVIPASGILTIDQSIHSGAHIKYNPKGEKLNSALQKCLANIIERGKAADEFCPEADPERIYFLSVVIATGCISSRPMFLRLLGKTENLDEDIDNTREYAVEFILRALRSTTRGQAVEQGRMRTAAIVIPSWSATPRMDSSHRLSSYGTRSRRL